MTATIEEFAKTVAEYEALALRTGEWDGIDSPEFSADGVTWAPVWLGDGTPQFARVTVYRKGVRVPYTAVIAWAEVLPAIDDWRALWERKPMTLFGAAAKRAAIRHAFRDVIGDRRDPDEADSTGPAAPAAVVDRTSWDDQIRDAATIDELDRVWVDMRSDRARTGAREVAYKARRRELVDAAWNPADLADMAGITETEATAAIEALAAAPAPGPARPAPRDYLPPAGNRAERRAAARRKGRRK